MLYLCCYSIYDLSTSNTLRAQWITKQNQVKSNQPEIPLLKVELVVSYIQTLAFSVVKQFIYTFFCRNVEVLRVI